jgi:hypothetical protein
MLLLLLLLVVVLPRRCPFRDLTMLKFSAGDTTCGMRPLVTRSAHALMGPASGTDATSACTQWTGWGLAWVRGLGGGVIGLGGMRVWWPEQTMCQSRQGAWFVPKPCK